MQLIADLGVKKVRITGGEPLMRSDAVEIVADIAEIPQIQDLAMTTNAVLLTRRACQLREAGLDRLNVSLDALTPDKYSHLTRGGDIRSFFRGMRAAEEVGFSNTKVNCVVLRGINDDQLGRLAELTHCKSWQVRFIEYMPVGASEQFPAWDEHFLPAEQIQQMLAEQWAEIKGISPDRLGQILHPHPTEEGTTARVYGVEGHPGTIGFIAAITDHFCSHCNRLRLTADGQLHHCLLDEGHVDLKGPLRSGAGRDELVKAITKAAERKPLKHSVDSRRARCIRRDKEMSKLGG